MRKSGPLRSIRLCAWIVVGAGSGMGMAEGSDGPAESTGPLANLLDRRCQTPSTSKGMQTDARTARRARIRNHSMGIASLRLRIRRVCLMKMRTRRYGLQRAKLVLSRILTFLKLRFRPFAAHFPGVAAVGFFQYALCNSIPMFFWHPRNFRYF